jgi:hypothetical protein
MLSCFLDEGMIVTAAARDRVTLQLTVGQSVSPSWCRAQSGAHDQIFILVGKLLSCPYGGALSDERMGLSFVGVSQ